MPTYVYSCKDCGKKFDKFRKMSERDDTIDCQCGSQNVVRGITVPMAYKIDGGIQAVLDKANGGDGIPGVSREYDELDKAFDDAYGAEGS